MDEIIKLMNKIDELMNLLDAFIYIYARNNPIVLDSNVIYRKIITIAPNSTEKITYKVPSGYRFYFYSWAGNYVENSEWKEYVDDKLIAIRTAPPQSLQDHQRIYPCIEIASDKVDIEIKNNDNVDHDYIIEIRGWLRK